MSGINDTPGDHIEPTPPTFITMNMESGDLHPMQVRLTAAMRGLDDMFDSVVDAPPCAFLEHEGVRHVHTTYMVARRITHGEDGETHDRILIQMYLEMLKVDAEKSTRKLLFWRSRPRIFVSEGGLHVQIYGRASMS